MLARLKPDPPSSDFEAATAKFQIVKREEEAAQIEFDGLRAVALRHRTSDDKEWNSERMAWPREKLNAAYGDKPLPAEWRLPVLTQELEERIAAARPRWHAAYLEYHEAKAAETRRIAVSLQGRQKAAVHKIADALRALSVATKEERNVREELVRIAPNGTSPFLPDCSPQIGDLEDHTSAPFEWRARMRRFGLLD